MTELISSFAGAAKASEGAVAAPPAPVKTNWTSRPAGDGTLADTDVDLKAAQACENLMLEGQRLLAEHKPLEARRYLLEAYRHEPRQADVCRSIGKTYLASGELIRAKLWFEAAAAINPTDARPWCDLGLLELRGGQPITAIALFEQSLRRDASHFPAWGGLATAQGVLQQHGPCLEAAEEALRLDPSLAHLHGLRGVALEGLGRLQEAEQAYGMVLAQNPGATDALNRLVALLQKQSKLEKAIEVMGSTLAQRPETTHDALMLAELYQLQGLLAEAEATLRRALALEPDNHMVLINLSNVLSQNHRPTEARVVVEQLLERHPFQAEAHLNLGSILLEEGHLEEAERATRRALALRVGLSGHNQAKAHMNLGCVLIRMGQNEEAQRALRQAITLNPDLADAHYNLGMLLKQKSHFEEASAAFERALALQNNHGLAAFFLGHCYREQGQEQFAKETFNHAAKLLSGELLPTVSRDLTLVQTAVATSPQAIHQARHSYRKSISALASPELAEKQSNILSLSCGNFEQFWLAYHNHSDDREILEDLAYSLRNHPALRDWVGPSTSQLPGRRDGPLRVGFCSEVLVDYHTIGKQFAGLIKSLSKAGLHTIVLTTSAVHQDPAHRAIAASASEAMALPARQEEAASLIRALDLDVLVYPDIGMTPFTYLLALARLAPVQVTSWGNPITTGSPCLDYYISSTLLEPEGAQAHYSEQLVCLSRLPCEYSALDPLPHADLRTSFELDAHATSALPEKPFWIGIPQTLFKFHPDFDPTLEAIASAIPSAVFVLLKGNRPQWCEALKKRWQQSAPQVFHRSVFLPRLSRECYLQLVDGVDLLLDTFFFGSGNTFYEAMTCGTPVITLPGRAMRGRVVAAAYRQMGVADAPIATSPADYVDWCIRLAADHQLRRDLKQRLREAAASRLFADTTIHEEFLEFFQAATEAARRGEKLPAGWSPAPSLFPSPRLSAP